MTAPASLRLESGSVEILKWCAIATMVIDHIDHLLLGRSAYPLALVGRLSFPLFAFLLVHNRYHFSRSGIRQVCRLLLVGAATQPVYMYAFEVSRLNILFTLGLGILAIEMWSRRRESRGAYLRALLVGALVFTGSIAVEYGPAGIALILAMHAFMIRPSRLRTTSAAVFVLGVNYFTRFSWAGTGSLLLIWAAHEAPLRMPRTPGWFFYGFYPAHIGLLVLARSLIS